MSDAKETTSRIPVADKGDVTTVLLRPADARALYVFGHGAGAGLRHAFMEETSARLAALGIATLRYHFPYMEAGKGRPDSRKVLLRTVRAAVAAGREAADGLPLFAGGKSMGGRMTSLAASETDETDGGALAELRGLVFFGFPLHAPGRPGSERGDHLDRVEAPMLFLQGTRDKLADLDLLRPVTDRLRDRATLHVVEGGDHSFKVLKRSGRSAEEVMDELAKTVSSWMLERVA